MKCPVCNIDLAMSDRQGIEIDYCPKCRGVWLDRGELDKIVERSAQVYDRASHGDAFSYRDDRRYDDRDYRSDDDRYRKRKKKRPESFLSDLFEFGD